MKLADCLGLALKAKAITASTHQSLLTQAEGRVAEFGGDEHAAATAVVHDSLREIYKNWDTVVKQVGGPKSNPRWMKPPVARPKLDTPKPTEQPVAQQGGQVESHEAQEYQGGYKI